MALSRRQLLMGIAAASVAPFSTRLWAKDATVVAAGVKFDPMFVYIEPGQAVSWTNMPSHNVELITAMIPSEDQYFVTELGADISHTFDVPGIYMYKCTPHWGTRMGGGIMVGSPDNPQGILDGYMEAIESDRGNLLPAKGLIKKFKKDLEARA